MANQEQVERLERSVEEWNLWRQQETEYRPDLRGANLLHARLRGANLRRANLASANFFFTDLRSTDLSYANLGYTDLRGANLAGARLRKADLSGANLGGADLSTANLDGADLSGATLSSTKLVGTIFAHVRLGSTLFERIDLSHVKDLETANHAGPSTVNINSVTLPLDERIRRHFLLGVGFTETQIEYLPSLLAPRSLQYHSLFLSYAHQDEAPARQLHADLRHNDVPCWFAPHDLKIGEKIRPRIDEAINMYDKLLLILSKHAIASSWVEKEVETALEKEVRQQCVMLFPIRVDESVIQTSQAWAADIRRMRHIGDFSNWQDKAAYQQAFSRLLRDLKVNSLPTP